MVPDSSNWLANAEGMERKQEQICQICVVINYHYTIH